MGEHRDVDAWPQDHTAQSRVQPWVFLQSCVPNHCCILPALPQALPGHPARKQGGDYNFPLKEEVQRVGWEVARLPAPAAEGWNVVCLCHLVVCFH